MTGPQFYQGAAVYDADDQQIGTLQTHDAKTGSLLVQKGAFFHKDLRLPVSTVQHSNAQGGIYLSLRKSDLEDSRYDVAAIHTGTDIVVPKYEEELVVSKRQEQVGDVHLHKDVVQEQQTVPVSLRRDEVTVERRPVQGKDVDPATVRDAFKDEDIDVPVMAEQAVVGKQVRETEEVRLHKESVTEQKQVTDTVRKEDVTIESDPAGLVSGDSAPRGETPPRTR